MTPLLALPPVATTAAPTTAALKTIGLLAILVFLLSYTYEVLFFNSLYESQQFLLVLLQLTLGLWAGLEWGLLYRRGTTLPLQGLGLGLGAQWLLAFIRYPLNHWVANGQGPTPQLFPPGDLSLAMMFVPLNLLVFLLISKQLIEAFAFMERERAAMLQREIASRLSAEEALNRSLTARLRAEAEVSTLRAQLERTAYEVTENIPVGTYTMVLPPGEALAHFSFMSRRFLELTGLDREVAASDPLQAFACVHPDDYDRWVRLNAAAFAHKQPFYGETRILVAGEMRWVIAESSPRDLPDGSTVWEGVLIDITARKQAEAALAQAHEELLAVQAERAKQEERRLLLQDLHDGVGSQLATARLSMSGGHLTLEEGATLLSECLADLHLVADTLGSPDNSLPRLLANYRYRCERRLAHERARIHWHLRLADCPPLPERTLLQLLRILQEGLNNALEHAQARHIQIVVKFEREEGLTLSVVDDGVGLPAEIRYGRGLGNMERRARDIGGRLILTRQAPGTRLVLTLPLSSPQALAAPSAGDPGQGDTSTTTPDPGPA